MTLKYYAVCMMHTGKQLRVSATPPLPFWTYYITSAHSITTPCTYMTCYMASAHSITTPCTCMTCYMASAHSITTPCICMNNTSCNQPKVVPETDIPVPRDKEWQSGLGTLELLAEFLCMMLLERKR